MVEKEILENPEHLLEKEIEPLSKAEVNSILRGLLAYEVRACPSSEHKNLHHYYTQLRDKRLKVAHHFIKLGGEVSKVVLCSSLPNWNESERPPIAALVKTHGHELHNA